MFLSEDVSPLFDILATVSGTFTMFSQRDKLLFL